MPAVASRIRIGYSNLRRSISRRNSTDSKIAPIEPTSTRSLQEAGEAVDDEAAAEGDDLVAAHRGDQHAGDDQQHDGEPGTSPAVVAVAAPGADHQERHGADHQDQLRQHRIDGGKVRSLRSSRHEPLMRQRRGLRRADRLMEAVEQRRHRRRRHVEDRLRIDADQDGEHDERRERERARARRDRSCAASAGFERAEDHLAVEPQRIAGRQDHAESSRRTRPRC